MVRESEACFSSFTCTVLFADSGRAVLMETRCVHATTCNSLSAQNIVETAHFFQRLFFGTFAEFDSKSETARGEEKDVWWRAKAGFKLKMMWLQVNHEHAQDQSPSFIFKRLYCAISFLLDNLQWAIQGQSWAQDITVTCYEFKPLSHPGFLQCEHILYYSTFVLSKVLEHFSTTGTGDL